MNRARMDLIRNVISEETFRKATQDICLYFEENEIDFMGALVVLEIVTKVIKNEMGITKFELVKGE